MSVGSFTGINWWCLYYLSVFHGLVEGFVGLLLLIRGIIENPLLSFFWSMTDVKLRFSYSLVLVLRNIEWFIIFVIRQPKFIIIFLPPYLLVTLLYLNDRGEHPQYRVILTAIALALIVLDQKLLRLHPETARARWRLFRGRLREQHLLDHLTDLVCVLHPQRVL